MPLSTKGQAILRHLIQEYGDKKGKSIFYAMENSGKFSGLKKIALRINDQEIL